MITNQLSLAGVKAELQGVAQQPGTGGAGEQFNLSRLMRTARETTVSVYFVIEERKGALGGEERSGYITGFRLFGV